MSSKPRKLLAAAPLLLGLAGCHPRQTEATPRAVVVPVPVSNAASAPAPATPLCDAETGRPLPGNVGNGERGCPVHRTPDAQVSGQRPAPAVPLVGSDNRPLPGNVRGKCAPGDCD